MNVPLLDLQGQYNQLKVELDEAVRRVVESQYFILGPEVTAFEEKIADYLGAKNALGVSSGTDALLLALMALEIGPGDEVIIPTFSFFATAGVVARVGATPVFADILPESYNIDPVEVERKLSEKTRAIIPVHLFGQGAEIERIVDVASRAGVPVVEDAAQAIGGVDDRGRSLGTVGNIGCFSFFPSKNLGAFGDAGLVVTDDPELFEKMNLMRVHGAAQAYRHELIGGNFRIDAIQATVLSTKLPHLEEWSMGRRRNASLYRRLLVEGGVSLSGGLHPDDSHPVALPVETVASDSGLGHIYNQFVIRVVDREGLTSHLKESGIGHSIYYPLPFHHQPCFAEYVGVNDAFPVADRAAAEVLALPIFPELTEEQIARVAEVILDYYRNRRSTEAN